MILDHVAGVLVAIATLVGAVGALFVSLRTQSKTKDLAEGQAAIHVLVNSRLTVALEKIAVLEGLVVMFTGAPKDEAIAAAKTAIERSRAQQKT